MHAKNKTWGNTARGVHLDLEFPKPHHTHGDASMFDEGCVAGRMPSKHRKPLSYYCQVNGEDRAYMKQNLNYIISYGTSISDETLSVIMRCLESGKTAHGTAPVWGAHETFEMGSW